MSDDGTPIAGEAPSLVGIAEPDALSIDTGKARFRTNLVASTVPYVVQTAIGIWFTPYLIHHLGIAVYGLVPLASQLTGYVSMLAMILSRPVSRFMTADLARGDLQAANRTFSTAFYGSLTWGLALAPIALAFAWLGPTLLDVPIGHEDGARAILAATTFGLLLAAVCTPFDAPIYANSRFDISGAITVVAMVFRVGIIASLFLLSEPVLWHVAVGLLAERVLAQAGTIVACRRLLPDLTLSRRHFDRQRFRELLGMGGWLTIGQFGSLLYAGIDLIVLNTMAGAHIAGLYAPVFQLTTMVRSLATMATGILAPTMIALRARGDDEALARTTCRACKLLAVALALPLGLLCGLARPLLALWLGDEFGPVGPVLAASLAPQALALAAIPLTYIPLATNSVKWPGVATVAQGILNLGLACVLTGHYQLGMYGVVISRSVAMMANAVGFLPIYSARVIQKPLTGFWTSMLVAMIATALTGAGGWWLMQALPLDGLAGMLAAGALIGLLYVPLAYLGLLRREDRELLVRLLLRRGETP